MSKLMLYTLAAVTALALSVAAPAGANVVPAGTVSITCTGGSITWASFPDTPQTIHLHLTQGTTVFDHDLATGGATSGTGSWSFALSKDGPATALITWTAGGGGSTTVTKTLACAPPSTTTTTSTTLPVHSCEQLETCKPPCPPSVIHGAPGGTTPEAWNLMNPCVPCPPGVCDSGPKLPCPPTADPTSVICEHVRLVPPAVTTPTPPAVPAVPVKVAGPTLARTGNARTDEAAVGLALIALGVALQLQRKAERKRGLRLDPTESIGNGS